MSSLETAEWKLLAGYIQSICGVHLDESKRYLVENRLSGLMQQSGAGTYDALYHKARGDSSGVLERSIIDAITTGETSFFRDDAPFQLLRNKILPEIIDSRGTMSAGKIPIRVWSAACSSGQEVYSIAIVLRDLLGPGILEKYDVRLVGTDISPDAIRRASRGVYNGVEAARGIDEGLRKRYLVQEGSNWRVRDEIRGLASFRVLNLTRDFSQLGQFDVIFCRNVAIYFSEADKISLFGRIEKALARDGYLIVGSTESLTGICPQFAVNRHIRTVYYRPAIMAVGREVGTGKTG